MISITINAININEVAKWLLLLLLCVISVMICLHIYNSVKIIVPHN